jgi:transposase
MINKHNMAQDAPTEDCSTKKFKQWIANVQLPVVDRFEINLHIQTWEQLDKQILEVEAELVKRSECSETKMVEVCRLKAIPGISAMGAITLLSRIGDVKRFKNPDSLANYFGLTPGCHNTGSKRHVGGITKRGNAVARHVLNFAVNHIVRKDPLMKAWFKKIKSKHGAKTARVAVMRRLATIIWHILRWGKPYQFRYDPPVITSKKGDLRSPKEVLGGIGNNHHSQKREKPPLKCRSKTKA